MASSYSWEVNNIDTLIINGDHAVDGRGIPIAITDERELIQRALLRLSIKKGSFAQDPELGSELYKLRHASVGADLVRAALSYVQEALLPMTEVEVADVSVERTNADSLRLNVTLATEQLKYRLEVDVN